MRGRLRLRDATSHRQFSFFLVSRSFVAGWGVQEQAPTLASNKTLSPAKEKEKKRKHSLSSRGLEKTKTRPVRERFA